MTVPPQRGCIAFKNPNCFKTASRWSAGGKIGELDNSSEVLMMRRFVLIVAMCGMLQVIDTSVQASIINYSDSFSTATTLTDEYWYQGEGTLAANNNAVVSLGNSDFSSEGRFFVGLGDTTGRDGTLTLTSADSTGFFILYGTSEGRVGRIGHRSYSFGDLAGTVNIEGGANVAMKQKWSYNGTAGNAVNVLNGILNLTSAGFVQDTSGGSLLCTIGREGKILVSGNVQSTTAFGALWGNSATDLGLAAVTGTSLAYTYNSTANTTTITAVPEPGTLAMCAACVIGLLAYAWRKRK